RWNAWHEQYADPASPLSQRLAVVVSRIQQAVDRVPPGPIRIISVCAGQGHDVVSALQGSPRAADVTGFLVEADGTNVAEAAAALRDARLTGIEAVCADASELDTYRDMPRADVLLLCGIFGNVSDSDVQRTIEHASTLCAPGAFVVWTRHRRAPDLTPRIRGWFDAAGYDEVSFDSPGADSFSVGMHRLRAEPAGPAPDVTLFRFIR
ncbi:MAG TPA: hypothetical protein VFL59_12115, partial [Candidatus Nanopelagicales bacterium]|nr:hypothetical protein [Candidatus Nanopelagicales bacterium]